MEGKLAESYNASYFSGHLAQSVKTTQSVELLGEVNAEVVALKLHIGWLFP